VGINARAAVPRTPAFPPNLPIKTTRCKIGDASFYN